MKHTSRASLTPVEQQELAYLFKQGKSRSYLMKRFSITRQTCDRLLKDHNVLPTKKRKYVKSKKEAQCITKKCVDQPSLINRLLAWFGGS